MEAKTCEEYVLGLLNDCQQDICRLQRELICYKDAVAHYEAEVLYYKDHQPEIELYHDLCEVLKKGTLNVNMGEDNCAVTLIFDSLSPDDVARLANVTDYKKED